MRRNQKLSLTDAKSAADAWIESPRLSNGSTRDRPPVAVALQYEHDRGETPRIVASGSGAVAERIVELARQHGIAVRENADLATMLHAVGVGERIPVAAFAIVAEILFHVLKANGRLPAAAERRP